MKEISKIISELTLQQKSSLCTGRGNWHFRGLPEYGIDEIVVYDGPHGLRKQISDPPEAGSIPATCFPTASALASSWNRELLGKIGEAIAGECLAEKVSVILGPGVNIKRSPLCGRNFEYFSEDPLLSGELAAALINGVQARGVGCSLKHFAANNQEKLRMTIDALIDERTLREIYLPAFETAVKKSNPMTIMCSYNRINGEYASENRSLLTGILREEWGWDGVMITDWGACNDRVLGLEAGQDIEMPDSGPENAAAVAEAVKTGRLPENVLDQSVERILTLLTKTAPAESPETFSADRHHLLSEEAASESIVLLRNQDAVLPIKAGEKIAVIGEFALKPRYQGAGSSRVNPSRLDNFLEKIRDYYPDAVYSPGYRLGTEPDSNELIDEALRVSGAADKIIILTGLPDEYESEGFDRSNLFLPEHHNQLISALCATGKKIIVCLSNGSPVAMPWHDKVSAVVECYLSGQAGAGALANILTGRISPSGKLAETFPLQLEDVPSARWFPGGPRQVEYREGLYVGYRYFETADLPVLYAFGHGLSYTDFHYSSLTLSSREVEVRAEASDAELISLDFMLKNSGGVDGREICQLYISGPGRTVHRPVKELKDFTKIQLSPGEIKKVSFSLNLRSFAHWDNSSANWAVEPGIYKILIGASVSDIRLKAELNIISDFKSAPQRSEYSRLRTEPQLIHNISDSAFSTEYGRELPLNILNKEIDGTTTLSQFAETFIGKLLLNYALKNAKKESRGNENSLGMYEATARDMPLHSMAALSGRRISRKMVDALIDMGRGQFLRGFLRFIKAGLLRRRI